MYLLISFFASVLPPPLWDTRKRVWAIADNAKVLLDIGCGYAHYTRSSKAITIIGIDLDNITLKEAYLHGNSKKFHAIFADASVLPIKNNVFDTIIATEILEHIPRDDLTVKEMYRVLRQKGRLLITTPNGDYLPRPDPHHIRHYKENEIISLLIYHFKPIKKMKRFDKSLLMVSYFTSLRGSMLLYLRRLGLTTFTRSRMDYTILFLFFPFLIILAPLVNLTILIEMFLGRGKYNLVIECIRK